MGFPVQKTEHRTVRGVKKAAPGREEAEEVSQHPPEPVFLNLPRMTPEVEDSAAGFQTIQDVLCGTKDVSLGEKNPA